MLQHRIIVGCVRKRLRILLCQPFNRASTSSVTSNSVSTEDQQKSIVEEVVVEDDNEIQLEQLRDISRMRPWHRSILHGEPPSIDTFKWQKERWALKERYAAYGRASGVDAGVHWPTSMELDEMRQEDEELEPKLLPTIEEMHRLRAERQQAEEQRYEELEKKAKEYPKILEAYRKKLRDEQALIDAEKKAKDDKIKEIQSYFGYAIDVSDPRFAAMMAKRELEEKQARRKQQKKEEELEAVRLIEEETKLLKQREQLQFHSTKSEKADEAQAKAQ